MSVGKFAFHLYDTNKYESQITYRPLIWFTYYCKPTNILKLMYYLQKTNYFYR